MSILQQTSQTDTIKNETLPISIIMMNLLDQQYKAGDIVTDERGVIFEFFSPTHFSVTYGGEVRVFKKG